MSHDNFQHPPPIKKNKNKNKNKIKLKKKKKTLWFIGRRFLQTDLEEGLYQVELTTQL